jgi:hypothetical protein
VPEPLQDRFDVKVGEDVYTFRMPTIRQDIEVGYRAAEIRQRAYPSSMGGLNGLDFATLQFTRYAAYLELYLIRSTTGWPFGISDNDAKSFDFNKSPEVKFEKFTFDRTDDVYAVGQAFEAEVARFRTRGDSNRPSAGT